ncbi:amino acid permease [Mariniluteicoccus endophyticus]
MATPHDEPKDFHDGDHDGLQRGLTSAQISMIGLSGALGTGLFLGSGSMISVTGPGIIVSYALCGLLALVIVFALAEMTVKHPVAGGFGASAHAYLGPLGGWIARWNVAVTMCIAVGAEVVASASYLTFWWPEVNLGLATVMFSLLLVVINILAVKIYGASEYWFSIIKVTMVVVFILLGLVLIVVGLPSRPATGFGNLTEHGGFAPNGWGAILVGAVMAIFSFGGAENVSLTAAESSQPERDIPRAARAMIFRLVLFYVGAIAIVVTLEPWTVSAQGDGTVASSPFVRVLAAAGIPAAAGIMNFILITAAMSSGNGCLYASSRMLHSLGQQGMAPAAVGRTTRTGAPRNAVLLATIGMAVASVLAIVRPDDAFQMLFGVLVFGLWLTWLMIMCTYVAFKVRRARLALPRASMTLAAPRLTAGIAIVALVAVGVSLVFIESLRVAWLAGLPYLVILLLAYAITSSRRGGFPRDGVLADELAEREDRPR